MNPKDTEWEEEFDEKFSIASFTWNGENRIGERSARTTRNSVRKYIRALLAKREGELISKIGWRDIEKEEAERGEHSVELRNEINGWNQCLYALLEAASKGGEISKEV